MAVKNITMSVLTRLKQQAKMDELISRSTKDIDFMVYRLSKENLDSIDRKSKNVIQLYYKGDVRQFGAEYIAGGNPVW